MKTGNIVQEKSYQFALNIITTTRLLVDSQREYALSRQLLKSGTSIGANVEEAIGGQSKRDFIAKLSIAYKEARETKYWLRLIRDLQLLTPDDVNPLVLDIDELLRIIGSILKTSREKT